MANRSDDLDAAMREITARRDNLVEADKAISADRLQGLHAVLASEFPVEMALSHAARQRDEMLADRVPVIPKFVEASLVGRLLARAKSAASPQPVTRHGRIGQRWWRIVHTPSALQLAATVALLAAGVVLISNLGSGRSPIEASSELLRSASHKARTAERVAHQPSSARAGDSFLPASNNQLTLRVSTTELAALQPSLLTAAFLPDRYDADLPLDLPVRQILMDAAAARTP
jgi:hypothetical protein